MERNRNNKHEAHTADTISLPSPAAPLTLPHNRVRAIMTHGWRYAFQPTERLARDVGVSPRTIRRLLSGETKNPPFRLVEAVAAALSRDLRRPPGFALPAREVFSPDGLAAGYPTPSTCELCDCAGCLPESAYNRHGWLRDEFKEASLGDWCLYPAASDAGTGSGAGVVADDSSTPVNDRLLNHH